MITWKGSTGRYVKIAVNHLTNLLRGVFRTYRPHDRPPNLCQAKYDQRSNVIVHTKRSFKNADDSRFSL